MNRVFIQVEMFGVTADETGNESAQLLDEFVSLQKEIFGALGLHYRLVKKGTQELPLVGIDTLIRSGLGLT